MQGVMRFGKKDKLDEVWQENQAKSAIHWPFEVLIGSIAYRYDLPPNVLRVHPVFLVSILKRYHGDDNYIIKWDWIV